MKQSINLKDTKDVIFKAAKSEKKGLRYLEKLNPFSGVKRRLKHNPLGDDNVYNTVRLNVKDNLASKLGIEEGKDKVLNSMVDATMDVVSKGTGKTFGHSVSYQLKSMGMNAKAAEIAGGSVYEAALLGAWDTIAGEAADYYAESLNLDPKQWGYEDWYNRAMHGMVVGSILAPIRYIPGGKQVKFGQSGMIADMKHITRFIQGRFTKSG